MEKGKEKEYKEYKILENFQSHKDKRSKSLILNHKNIIFILKYFIIYYVLTNKIIYSHLFKFLTNFRLFFIINFKFVNKYHFKHSDSKQKIFWFSVKIQPLIKS